MNSCRRITGSTNSSAISLPLNAKEEPENPDYPKDPEFRKKYHGPRGVIHSYADGKIEDTGSLTKKRMETVDEEFLAAAKGLHGAQSRRKPAKPFFCWFNSTRMHVFTWPQTCLNGRTGLGLQADGMTEHDEMVGDLLKLLDDMKIADNTSSSTPPRPRDEEPVARWRRLPFRSEKDTGWREPHVPASSAGPATSSRTRPRKSFRRRLASHACCRCRRRRSQPPGKCHQGRAGGREAFQGPSRWLQPGSTTGQAPSARHEYVYQRRRRSPRLPRGRPLQISLRSAVATGMAVWRMPLTRCARRS